MKDKKLQIQQLQSARKPQPGQFQQGHPQSGNSGAPEVDDQGYLLIIDDDNTLLKFFKIHLNKLYPKIIVADSAKMALQKIKDNKIDVVITDYRMPKVNGLDLIQKIKKSHPTLPALMVTGALLSNEETADIHKFCDGMLRKPFTVEDLHSLIESGFTLKKLFGDLNKLVPAKKDFLALVSGEKKPSVIVKANKLKEVQDIIDQLPAKAS